MVQKKLLFITGTRADYGKLKPLLLAVEADSSFELNVFVCGMHLSEKFGSTYHEVLKDGYQKIYVAFGLNQTCNTSVSFGNTVSCLTGYIESIKPDLIVVHGDRTDALAGAIVGVLNNITVAHIEGGELSGTVDESIRHAISKFAHAHFVCNEEAEKRLLQLGEEKNRVHVIGSPDIDIMLSDSLPNIHEAKRRYGIDFDRYAILMYHPVTTEYSVARKNAKAVIDAAIKSEENYIVVYPNNDLGSEIILDEYKRLNGDYHFAVFPSLRFEYFLTLLKNADFIMGNSSAGIRESGVYGVPAIDIGSRQSGRYSTDSSLNILHASDGSEAILEAMAKVNEYRITSFCYGKGGSVEEFLSIIRAPEFWKTKIQKRFMDADL